MNILCCIAINAQIQQGFVKTPTRRNADGTWRKGEHIQGATVGIQFANKGQQTYISGSNGYFSFDMSSPQFSVSSVTARKGTYTFVDSDFSKKQRLYSKNPLEVLVDDPNVLAKVREESINKERAKLRKQIRAKEDKIEELKAANKITTEECNRMLDQLDQYRKSSEEIVRQIAEVYVTTDYDNLSDFNRLLLQYIEDGNYNHVDSLLKTNGNREGIYADIIRRKEAIRETRENLKKAEAYDAIDTKDFAQRLYYESVLFMQQPMMQDSALHCLKLRADLDTTNVEFVWDYAELARKQKKFSDAELYYKICKRSYQGHNDTVHFATALHYLGVVYIEQGKFDLGEEYFKNALQYREKLYEGDSDEHRKSLTLTLNNLGCLYKDLNKTELAKTYLHLALENVEILFKQNPDIYQEDLARLHVNLGALYNSINDFAYGEKYSKLAIEGCELLFKQNPDAYRAALAMAQMNLGSLYGDLRDYENSKRYRKLAFENYEQLFKENPDAYRAELAMAQMSLGILYFKLHDYENSENHYKLACEHYEQLFVENPDSYRADLAKIHYNLGQLCRNVNDYINSEKHYLLALKHFLLLFSIYPDVYRSELAGTQFDLGCIYCELKDYISGEKFFKQAMENYEQLYNLDPESYHSDVAKTQENLGLLYNRLNDTTNSEKFYKLALQNYDQLVNQNLEDYYEDLAEVQDRLGLLYFKVKDYTKSEKYFLMSIHSREQMYKKHPQAYCDILAKTYEEMSLLCATKDDTVGYDTYLRKALELRLQLYKSHPEENNKANIIDLQNRMVWRLLQKGKISEAINLAQKNYNIDNEDEITIHYLAKTYYCKADSLLKTSDFNNSEKYYTLALELYEKLYADNPDICRVDYTNALWETMLLYGYMNNIEEYDKYLDKTLTICSLLYQSSPEHYKQNIIELKGRRVMSKIMKGYIEEAMSIAEEVYAMDESNEQSRYCLAECYNAKAYECAKQSDYTNAIKSINESITLVPTNANFYDSKGEILLMQGKDKEALEMWKIVLELNPKFLDDYPNGTSLSNGLKEKALIE